MIEDGLENFSFEVLEECSRDELNEKEKYYPVLVFRNAQMQIVAGFHADRPVIQQNPVGNLPGIEFETALKISFGLGQHAAHRVKLGLRGRENRYRLQRRHGTDNRQFADVP